MSLIDISTNQDVESTFQNYPANISKRLLQLREIILDVASELNIKDLEETLKWGEPSYLSKQGSTLRIAWRKSKPSQYAMFFNCKTTLVETFKEVFQDTFEYEDNRAILFEEDQELPVQAIKQCIELTLTYHKVKHLPLLGL